MGLPRLFLLSLLLALPAAAQDGDDVEAAEGDEAEEAEESEEVARAEDTSRSGVYLALAGHAHLENFGSAGAKGVKVDNSAGGSARIGYRANPTLAVEFMGEWLADFGDQGDDGFWAGVSAKGYLPQGRFQPYLLLGGGLMQAPVPGKPGLRESLAFRFGGGIDVYVLPQVALFFEGVYVQPTWNDVDEVAYGSVGLGAMYRF